MSKGTIMRSVRIVDELWRAAQKKARQEGITVSEHIRQDLIEWSQT